jgi:hypothetical protein
VGFPKSEKKVVARPDITFFNFAWRIDNHHTGLCFGSVYLCNILI